MKTPDGSPDGRRALSGARQGLVGAGLLVLAFFVWEARGFIPTLATTRVMAGAVIYTLHDGSEAQVQRAFAAAKMSCPAEATLETERDSTGHSASYLTVTADTSERARADLATLTNAIRAAFPSAERNLLVSPNNSTVPAPNDLSRRLSFGVRAAVVLMLLGAQLLLVIGAHRQGIGRAGLFATITTPFLLALFPADSYTRITHRTSVSFPYTDYRFLLVLLAVTPLSVILILWLTRASRRAGQPDRRARRPRPGEPHS
jgi:hypothetical protein